MNRDIFKVGDVVFCARWTPDLSENDVILPIGIVIAEEDYGQVLVEWTNAYLDERIQPWDVIDLRHLGGIYE
tara:strand:+ start:359 stop:574 length:216 start_codon:yes stop_codon:yes gene_type:complete